jgi:hypothetical protein
LGAIVHRGLARRFASGELRPPRDREALGAWVVVGLFGTLVLPGLVPMPLLVFPPRADCALPFIAVAAALGIEACSRVAVRTARVAWINAAVVAAVLALTLRAPATLGAYYDALLGGPRAVSAARLFTVGDGSEIAAIAPALDALGSDVSLQAREIPEEYWDVLRAAGRMRATVRSGAEYILERGAAESAQRIATVQRSGALLWTLARR